MKKSHIIMIVVAVVAVLGYFIVRKMIANKKASDVAAATAATLQNLVIKDQVNRNTQPDYQGIPPMPPMPANLPA